MLPLSGSWESETYFKPSESKPLNIVTVYFSAGIKNEERRSFASVNFHNVTSDVTMLVIWTSECVYSKRRFIKVAL